MAGALRLMVFCNLSGTQPALQAAPDETKKAAARKRTAA